MKIRFIIIGVLLMGMLAGGIYYWQSHRNQDSASDLILYGNVDIREVQLAFNGSERIVGMLAQEGDRVAAGQLLATLDSHRLKQAVARAEARAEAQRQVLVRLEAGTRPEEIRKARADVAAAAAEARNAEQIYQRRRPLVDRNAVSREQADNARADADTTRAKLKAAEEALELAVLGPRTEDIAAARATLQVYAAELALAQRELIDAALYSPSDGVIRDRILEPGDMASPQRPVYTLALTDPVWVRTYVPETDLGKISLGMAASVTTGSYPEKSYRAWVGYISPTAEFTPKTVETTEVRTSLVYQVRVFVCNPLNELRLGMPATVSIALNQPPAAESADASKRCKDR